MSSNDTMCTPVHWQLDKLFKEALLHAHSAIPAHLQAKIVYTETGVPDTGKGIHSMYCEWLQNVHAEFRVFSDANTAEYLYFSPSTNLLYRLIHDIDHAVHYDIGRGTTKYTDEKYLNCLMAKRAYEYATLHADRATALLLFFSVYHDTVGQAEFYKDKGEFCNNQRQNTITLMNECKGVQAVKSGRLGVAKQIMYAFLIDCGV